MLVACLSFNNNYCRWRTIYVPQTKKRFQRNFITTYVLPLIYLNINYIFAWPLCHVCMYSAYFLYFKRGGVGGPRVSQCDGDYNYDSRRNLLEWTMPVIDESNATGTVEFSIAGNEDDFFPVSVSFVSKKSFFDISVSNIPFLWIYRR